MRHQLDLSSHTEMWERIKFTKENNLALQLRTSRLRRYYTQWLYVLPLCSAAFNKTIMFSVLKTQHLKLSFLMQILEANCNWFVSCY